MHNPPLPRRFIWIVGLARGPHLFSDSRSMHDMARTGYYAAAIYTRITDLIYGTYDTEECL